MSLKAKSIEDYLDSLDQERKEVIVKLMKVVSDNLPQGFQVGFYWDSITYVIPFELYPPGYHVDKKHPLPFISISNWKNHISFSHWGLYIDPNLLEWFKIEYAKSAKYKLAMGKSCVNLKRMDDIPYNLIGELCQKITPQDFIKMYEKVFLK